MSNSNIILNQIISITRKLMGIGLSVQQNFPVLENNKVFYKNSKNLSYAMKNHSYEIIYDFFNTNKNYNIKMIDGALIQMLYTFEGENLKSHRLAFFPSPSLESFQNDLYSYENDEKYSDILAKNIVTFPLRFDFNSDDKIFIEIHHSKSHLSLGQFKNCRIPVSEPLTPEVFISFLLQSFYNQIYLEHIADFETGDFCFSKTITNKEKNILHFGRY